jgi:hypothetical protein
MEAEVLTGFFDASRRLLGACAADAIEIATDVAEEVYLQGYSFIEELIFSALSEREGGTTTIFTQDDAAQTPTATDIAPGKPDMPFDPYAIEIEEIRRGRAV